jgi:hypothetical protein
VIAPAIGVVAPGESKALTAELNLASEPDFRGALRIEVTGSEPGGTVVLKTHVDVAVQESSADERPSGPADARGARRQP